MSDRATGILSHSLVDFEQVLRLTARLETCTDLAVRVAEEYCSAPGTYERSGWRLGKWGPPGKATPEEQWIRKQGPAIYGPAHTWIVFGERCLFVSTHVK